MRISWICPLTVFARRLRPSPCPAPPTGNDCTRHPGTDEDRDHKGVRMIINCFYDENMEHADIIFIPDIFIDIEKIQNDFLSWMFDAKSNHKYWIEIKGIKVCNYGTEEFVEWINSTLLKENCKKSYILEKNTKMWDMKNQQLVF